MAFSVSANRSRERHGCSIVSCSLRKTNCLFRHRHHFQSQTTTCSCSRCRLRLATRCRCLSVSAAEFDLPLSAIAMSPVNTEPDCHPAAPRMSMYSSTAFLPSSSLPALPLPPSRPLLPAPPPPPRFFSPPHRALLERPLGTTGLWGVHGARCLRRAFCASSPVRCTLLCLRCLALTVFSIFYHAAHPNASTSLCLCILHVLLSLLPFPAAVVISRPVAHWWCWWIEEAICTFR
jgi:hypothetical protein